MKVLVVTGREYRQLNDLAARVCRINYTPEEGQLWVDGVRAIVGFCIPADEYEVRVDWFATSIPLVRRIQDL